MRCRGCATSIENELNSANDNPIIDAEGERVLHGGHFYGGHIAFAMDSMKNAVANLADLLDRQMALLVDSRYNNGLPANLSGAHRPARGDQSWTQGAADQRLGVDRGSAQVDDAGVGVFPLHRVPQSGQGQHGHHRGARLPAGAGVDRAGGRRMLITVRQGVWLRCRLNPLLAPRRRSRT